MRWENEIKLTVRLNWRKTLLATAKEYKNERCYIRLMPIGALNWETFCKISKIKSTVLVVQEKGIID